MLAAARQAGLDAYPGIELSAETPHGQMHLVGLAFNPADRALNAKFAPLLSGRESRNAAILQALREHGIPLEESDVRAFAGDELVSRVHFAQALVQHGHATDVPDAFARFLAKGAPCYRERFRYSPAACIDMIRAAGGLVILLFSPYRVGDWIEAQGVQGTVREIQIFHTILLTADGKQVYMPNGSLSTSVVVNYSKEEYRRVQWVVGVDYGQDVSLVREKVLAMFKADSRVVQDVADKQPFIGLETLADSSVNLTIRVWVKTADYWPMYYEGQQQVYELFNREGINIPFPQAVVHLEK